MGRKLRAMVALLSLLGAQLGACGGGAASDSPQPTQPPVPAAPALTFLNLDAPSSSIVVNGSVLISPTTTDLNGKPVTASVIWSAANAAIVSVNPGGLVTGRSSGTSVVTAAATASGVTLTKTLTISVMPPWTGAPPPANILVNNAGKANVLEINQHEPAIAVSGSRIVVGWNDETISFGQTVRGVKRGVAYGWSVDAGTTFTDAGEIGSSRWGADASIGVDRSGNFYFGRMDLAAGSLSVDRISVLKSTNGGVTFGPAVSASNTPPGASESNDKPTIAVDNTGSQFDGNVYASWTIARLNALNIWFSRSTDLGASFSSPLQLSSATNAQASIPVVGPAGEIYVVWFDQDTGEIFLRKSMDGGLSFGPTTVITTATHIGTLESETSQYCGRVLRGSVRARAWPSVAIDRSNGPARGTLYVAYSSHGAGSDKADIYLTKSVNGGANWSTPARLNDDATTNDQWLPSVAVAPNGAVGVSWYDRRLDGENMLSDLFMRISHSGGAAFGPNLKVTEVSFPPLGISRSLSFPPYTCYFSSYNGMVADATAFYLVWTDNRQVRAGNVDPNIYFAKVTH